MTQTQAKEKYKRLERAWRIEWMQGSQDKASELYKPIQDLINEVKLLGLFSTNVVDPDRS